MPIAFKDNESYVVICPKERQDDFLRLRRECPLLRLSIYTKEEAVGLFGRSYDARAVSYLLSKGIKYSLAKELLEAFCAPKFEKTTSPKLLKYKQYYDELTDASNGKTPLLARTFSPESSFKDKHIIINGYGEASRISEYISSCTSNMTIDFDIEGENEPPKMYLEFPDIYEELHYVFNEIAKKIDEGTKPDDIYIVGADDQHSLYLKDFAKYYGFGIDMPSSTRLCDHPSFRLLEEEMLLDSPFDEALAKVEREYPSIDFMPLRNEVTPLLEPFERSEEKLKIIKEIAKTLVVSEPNSRNAVHLSSHFIVPKGAKAYIINFAMGSFPLVYKENGYLSDFEKKEIGLGTSKEMTIDDMTRLDNLLKSGQIELITFKKMAFGKTVFPSGLAATYGIEKAIPSLKPYEYSHAKGAFLLSMLKDKEVDYDECDERIAMLEKNVDPSFRTYDYKVSEKNIPIENDGRVFFTQGSHDDYASCPFKYLYNRHLKLAPFESTFYIRIGNIFHKVLEWHHADPSIDPLELYKKAVEEENDGQPFNAKERFILDNIAAYSKKDVLFHDELGASLEKYSSEEEAEGEFNVTIDEKTELCGRFDKRISFSKDGAGYLMIIDYKTGGARFDYDRFLSTGVGSQLPIYLYAASNDPKYEDYKVAGLFIAPLLKDAKETQDKDGPLDDTDRGRMRLEGAFIDDPSLWTQIGLWTERNVSLAFAHMSIVKGGNFKKSGEKKYFLSEEEFEKLCNSLVNRLKNESKAILNGEFEINPIRIKNKVDACEYCSFRDVCYRSEKDFPLRKANGEKIEEDTESEEKDGLD